jgi:NarL family two-component system sensor histidine kinase YdfH
MFEFPWNNGKNIFCWFLLTWVALVGIGVMMNGDPRHGGVSGSFVISYQTQGQSALTTDSMEPNVQNSVFQNFPGMLLVPATSTTGGNMLLPCLLLGYMLLLWLGLRAPWAKEKRELFFFAQAAAILLLGIVVQQMNLTVNLCLVMILSALVLYERIMPVIVVACGAFLCLIGSIVISLMLILPTEVQGPFLWLNLLSVSDYTGMIFFVTGCLFLYRQQRKIHDQLRMAHAQLAESSQQVERLTLLNERQRLARELHDTLAQGVAGLILQLNAARKHLQKEHQQQAMQILEQTAVSARGTLKEARQAINDLRSQTTPAHAFLLQCYEEIERFRMASSLHCFSKISEMVNFPGEYSEHVLRFLREALMNVARHAQATEVEVVASVEPTIVTLRVEDNGQGFQTTPQQPGEQSGHYGLIGLRERAHLLRGQLMLWSETGKGTTLILQLPRYPQEETG